MRDFSKDIEYLNAHRKDNEKEWTIEELNKRASQMMWFKIYLRNTGALQKMPDEAVGKAFKGALVTYTAEEKVRLAKVSQDTIDEYGVVSDEVAIEMAEGGKRALKVDYCVSVTGNAGPTCEPGGKPVGEVHIAVATKFGTVCQKFLFKGNRKHIQSMCVRKMIHFVSNSLTF